MDRGNNLPIEKDKTWKDYMASLSEKDRDSYISSCNCDFCSTIRRGYEEFVTASKSTRK